MNNEYDAIVLGGGPAGNSAAIKAAQLGAKTALIEKEYLGGVCLNHGCIPTKFFLESVSLLKEIQNAQNLGIKTSSAEIDLNLLQIRKNKILQLLRKSIETSIKNNKISYFVGEGIVLDPQTIEIKNEERSAEVDLPPFLKSSKIILATGSRPLVPKSFADNKKIITSDEALEAKEIPHHMVIIGAGAIGVEFASIYQNFGSKITIIEMLPQLLPSADKEVAALLTQLFKRQGIKVITRQKVEKISHLNNILNVFLSDGSSITADRILLALGRSANLEPFKNLNLKLRNDFVEVDNQMQTSIKGVYAAGDILGGYMLAYTACAEGIAAAQSACGKPAKIDYATVPFCVFCIPQVAWVGLTEEEATRKRTAVKTKKFLFRSLGKSHIIDKIDGFFKIVADEKDKILGVHIIGHLATELIGEAQTAIKAGFTAKDLACIIHAHPTFYEGMMETGMLS